MLKIHDLILDSKYLYTGVVDPDRSSDKSLKPKLSNLDL